ncbi:hypothetical protein BDV25DRAFT_150894 [Aspergillus avenaceus]|uniref:Arabinosidase n=1 Tax=Aspergillus avenaceus TaxID=36643 RepID=A0A5N6U1N5_ASPAV|nr:hypothetical protein BDV25DRAFT_150894 [Aspergillus avenaceus]
MKLAQIISTSLALSIPALASPVKRDEKAGYLSVYWTTEDESVFFALSENDDPLDFSPVNGGRAVATPTIGTGAVRDTSIIAGQGESEGKYWIIGTDLNIGKTTWDNAVRNGSRAIYVWESNDLVNWDDTSLVTVEDTTAGMVWAPDAIWDPEEEQYLVHWASKLYSETDAAHKQDPQTPNILRYAHTKDFKTFTQPQTYLQQPTDIIDLSFLPLNETTFLRSYRDDSGGLPVEISTTGLRGEWTFLSKPPDSGSFEGPYFFRDNLDPSKGYFLADLVGSRPGVQAWVSSGDVAGGVFVKDTDHELGFMRHNSVLAVTGEQVGVLRGM